MRPLLEDKRAGLGRIRGTMPRRPPKGDDERPGGASRRVKVKAPSEKLEADLKAMVGSSRHSCIRFLEYGAQRGSRSRNPRCTSASVESENIEAKKRRNGVLRVPTSHLSCSRLQPRHSNKGISDAYHCSQRQQNLHFASPCVQGDARIKNSLDSYTSLLLGLIKVKCSGQYFIFGAQSKVSVPV